MVYIDGVKYACQRCIRGHRVTTCNHTDQELIKINPKGRPATQCKHCKEARKTNNHHSSCSCGKNKKVTAKKKKDPNSKDSPKIIGETHDINKGCKCDDTNKCICKPRRSAVPEVKSETPSVAIPQDTSMEQVKSLNINTNFFGVGNFIEGGAPVMGITDSLTESVNDFVPPVSPGGFASDWELSSANGNASDVPSNNTALHHQDSMASLNQMVNIDNYSNNIYGFSGRYNNNSSNNNEVGIQRSVSFKKNCSSSSDVNLNKPFNVASSESVHNYITKEEDNEAILSFDKKVGEVDIPLEDYISPDDKVSRSSQPVLGADVSTDENFIVKERKLSNVSNHFNKISPNFDNMGHGLLDLFSNDSTTNNNEGNTDSGVIEDGELQSSNNQVNNDVYDNNMLAFFGGMDSLNDSPSDETKPFINFNNYNLLGGMINRQPNNGNFSNDSVNNNNNSKINNGSKISASKHINKRMENSSNRSSIISLGGHSIHGGHSGSQSHLPISTNNNVHHHGHHNHHHYHSSHDPYNLRHSNSNLVNYSSGPKSVGSPSNRPQLFSNSSADSLSSFVNGNQNGSSNALSTKPSLGGHTLMGGGHLGSMVNNNHLHYYNNHYNNNNNGKTSNMGTSNIDLGKQVSPVNSNDIDQKTSQIGGDLSIDSVGKSANINSSSNTNVTNGLFPNVFEVNGILGNNGKPLDEDVSSIKSINSFEPSYFDFQTL